MSLGCGDSPPPVPAHDTETIAGLGISRTISIYARSPTVISAGAILLAIGVSTLVGIVFGLYPAAKAARVDVIESLR